MLQKYASLYAVASLRVAEAKWFWVLLPHNLKIGDLPITREQVETGSEDALRLIRKACLSVGLTEVLPELDRLENLIWRKYPGMPQISPAEIATAITHFLSRLQDDLKSHYFFHLDKRDVTLFTEKNGFGGVVVKKFPLATEDIAEAGRCLALQRPTACVFHLMRAMEVAVRRLGVRMGVTITPQTTWRKITGDMDHKIKAMPEATARQKAKKDAWSEARANLHHVGQVWRNNTMHPARRYTPSQARDVWNASRVSMMSLAKL